MELLSVHHSVDTYFFLFLQYLQPFRLASERYKQKKPFAIIYDYDVLNKKSYGTLRNAVSASGQMMHRKLQFFSFLSEWNGEQKAENLVLIDT